MHVEQEEDSLWLICAPGIDFAHTCGAGAAILRDESYSENVIFLDPNYVTRLTGRDARMFASIVSQR